MAGSPVGTGATKELASFSAAAAVVVVVVAKLCNIARSTVPFARLSVTSCTALAKELPVAGSVVSCT